MIAQLQEQLNQKELEACALRAGIIALRRQIPHEGNHAPQTPTEIADAVEQIDAKISDLSNEQILSLQNQAIDHVLRPDRYPTPTYDGEVATNPLLGTGRWNTDFRGSDEVWGPAEGDVAEPCPINQEHTHSPLTTHTS
jgi:hypothetical protein